MFNEEEHLSMMTKWKYDSDLDLESANWLIEYYLTGKEIIKSYLEDNDEFINVEFDLIEKNNNIIKNSSIETNITENLKNYDNNVDNIDNNYIKISLDDIYVVGENSIGIENNLEIENNMKIENNLEIENNIGIENNLEIKNNSEIENIDDLIKVYPSNKKKCKIIIN